MSDDAVAEAHAAAIRRVAAYVGDHPGEAHALQNLADLAAMTKRAFSRHFLAVMRVGVNAFVRSVRVAHARRLLEQTDLSVIKVMRASGFPSTEAGRRAFLLLERTTPVHFRTRHRRATGSGPPATVRPAPR